MCGILGGFTNSKNITPSRIRSALFLLKNRGPDDSGFLIENDFEHIDLFLGHTRLSIIDLSSAGKQPMSSANNRFRIVFNGEIYNYKELRDTLKSKGYSFLTNTDTEVLISAWEEWGESCLQKLDGMFAFVIYDKQKKQLFCVRDQFGIKPLFYSISKDSFYFASQIDVLFKLNQRKKYADLQKSYDYLVYGYYDNDDKTFYKDVKNLRPGTYLRIDLGHHYSSQLVKWYVPNTKIKNQISFEDATEKVREQFLQNIKLQLRSDVPIGIALSGGIDSASIACGVRYLEPDAEINTFSYIAKNSEVSEEHWVDTVNNYIGAKSHKVVAGPDDLIREIDKLIFSQGEPFASTSIYAHFKVCELAKSFGIKVALEGQGADELLAGYRGYPVERIQSLLINKDITSLVTFMQKWSSYPGRSMNEALKFLIGSLLTDNMKTRFLRKNPKWINPEILEKEFVNKDNFLNNINYKKTSRRVIDRLCFSLQENGLPQLLRHGDRNSMNFSVESRVPFLNTDLCDLVLSLPEEYLISNEGITKKIFREAMRGIVPENVLNRKDKIGFATPEDAWLKYSHSTFREWIKAGINVPIFNHSALIKDFDASISNNKNDTHQTWRWINFIRWSQLNNLN